MDGWLPEPAAGGRGGGGLLHPSTGGSRERQVITALVVKNKVNDVLLTN